ncbi:TonB domain-containing protein [Burkholderia pseudomallei]|nr:TonB domain-containing protein [Burkholderia pseudomallei]
MTTRSELFRFRAAWRGAALCACAAVLAACTITLPPPHGAVVVPGVSSMSATEYRAAIAQRIADSNSDRILHGTPQAMLRSLVVVAFTVDRNGQLVKSAVYRSNGDDEAEGIALASLRRAVAAAAREDARRARPARVDGKLALQRQRAISVAHESGAASADAQLNASPHSRPNAPERTRTRLHALRRAAVP